VMLREKVNRFSLLSFRASFLYTKEKEMGAVAVAVEYKLRAGVDYLCLRMHTNVSRRCRRFLLLLILLARRLNTILCATLICATTKT